MSVACVDCRAGFSLSRRAAHASVPLRLATCRAGSPPRRAGNFSLLRQRKVTKREALNRTPAPQARTASCNSQWHLTQMRTAALSRLTCDGPASSHSLPVRRAAARRAHQNSQRQRRSGDATARTAFTGFVGWGEPSEPQHRARPLSRRPSGAAFVDEPGVQPALSGVKVRRMALVIGTAARAQRVASGRNTIGRFRAPLLAASRSYAVQGLFFGDFLLAPQKKVTPPPGGTPGTTLGRKPERQ